MPLVVRCACLFGRCCDSDLFVHQAHMDGWMEIFLRRRYTYFSLSAPSADHHIRVRIITTPPMRDHSSFVIEGAACYQHSGARYAHSLSCTIRATRHTAMITAAMVPMRMPNARASTPSSQRCKAAADIKVQAQRAAIAVEVIVMIDAWCASSHRSERVDQHQSSLALARRKHTH